MACVAVGQERQRGDEEEGGECQEKHHLCVRSVTQPQGARGAGLHRPSACDAVLDEVLQQKVAREGQPIPAQRRLKSATGTCALGTHPVPPATKPIATAMPRMVKMIPRNPNVILAKIFMTDMVRLPLQSAGSAWIGRAATFASVAGNS